MQPPRHHTSASTSPCPFTTLIVVAVVDVVGFGVCWDVRDVGCADGSCGRGDVVVGCGALVGRVAMGKWGGWVMCVWWLWAVDVGGVNGREM